MKNPKFYAAALFTLLLALGFVQERLKISLNFYLEQSVKIPGFYELNPTQRSIEIDKLKSAVHAPYDYYWSHKSVYAYNYLSLKSLTALKWGLALVFVAIAFVLSQAILKQWFGSTYKKVWLVYIFAGILFLLAFMALGSLVFNLSKLTYPVMRELLGIIQSPVPLIVLGILMSFNSFQPVKPKL